MTCEHKRIKFDNSGSEQRSQCLECGGFVYLTFKKFDDMKPKDSLSTNFKVLPIWMSSPSIIS